MATTSLKPTYYHQSPLPNSNHPGQGPTYQQHHFLSYLEANYIGGNGWHSYW